MNTKVEMSDVLIAVQAIDAATQRGGFKGEEMEVIGAVRNRLAAACKAASEDETASPENQKESKPAEVQKIVKES